MRFEIYCDDKFNPCMENTDWNPWMCDSLVTYLGDNHMVVVDAPNYDEV